MNAIIGLGRSLGLLTTADGIETSTDLEYLTDYGCTFGQGVLFRAPIPANRVPAVSMSYEDV